MNDRIRRLAEEARDSLRFSKFVRYCQAEGLGSVGAEHDRYYTESQGRFFSIYERQMAESERKQNWMLHALEGVVGVED